MKYRYLVTVAVLIMGLVAVAYIYQFYLLLGYSISNETEKWAHFGDYFGGVLNPILSFIALLFLVQSLNLQNQANRALRDDLENARKQEKYQSFGSLFFNIIEAQKNHVNNMALELNPGTSSSKVSGIDAILQLEQITEALRKRGLADSQVEAYLWKVDYRDSIFGSLRSFYLGANLVVERLRDDQGFSASDRLSHYQTLINFTDFSQLRLVLLATQFMNCHYSTSLKNNSELLITLEALGMRLDLY